MHLHIILHYYCDQPSSFSQAPSACGVQCSTERLVYLFIDLLYVPCAFSDDGTWISELEMFLLHVINVSIYHFGSGYMDAWMNFSIL